MDGPASILIGVSPFPLRRAHPGRGPHTVWGLGSPGRAAPRTRCVPGLSVCCLLFNRKTIRKIPRLVSQLPLEIRQLTKNLGPGF